MAFGNAISRAYDAAESRVIERITSRLAQMTPVPAVALESV
jgi:glycerol-3-phosphate acyltransferase PlsX